MKKNIGKTPYLYPIPIVLVSSMVDGKPNHTTVGDVAILGLNPALMTVSLNEKHHTTKGIADAGKFSINIPTTDMMKIVDYCGIYSGREKDKSELFTYQDNEFNVPIISECPASVVCKVVKDFSIEHRHIFVGEVLGTFIDENYIITENKSKKVANMEMLKPLIYGLDNKYYSIGKQIGTGYFEGKDLDT